ncbi:patatin-like phospholipase family protein [Hyphomicrobium sp.]|uniref:patatin-like phospholipase family protein n=1 Tax=Hyphomicrobium sp. TaxID=82 RepID=UPI0025C60418|nr:patatin-like phospholipase family protein [Hyphomicrobium sp.]MCC7253318.1 patatin-like phospholipase family protein [Hyphomicrobium sp.]
MADTATPRIAAKRGQHGAGRLPSIGLVLGGGGARGLAHILMLEVFDELGIKPKIIAGTSIGAIYGAAYAAGLAACDIRAHTEDVLTKRIGLVRDLFAARVQGNGRFWDLVAARTAFLAPGALLDLVLPKGVPQTFEELPIPLRVVASDFYALEAAVFSSGPLRAAVAASMALPVIFEPVLLGGRSLIDGGLTNPLPFDLIAGEADILVAIDVSGTTVPSPSRPRPTAIEALFASSFLFERSIVREKLKAHRPDIYIDAGTGRYQALEFLKVREILAAAEPAKAQLRAQLEQVLALPPGARVSASLRSGEAPG